MSRTVAISCAVLVGVATGPFVPTWPGASAHTTQPAACAPAHISPPALPGPVTATRDHFAGHAEPALAVNPRTARNLLGAAQFALPGSFTRVPGTFYSTDGGRTWHDNGPLPLPPGYGYGDDVSAAFAGRTGLVAAEIYRADGSGGRVFAWRTTDGGRRFSPPVPVSAAPARTDHPWLAVTTGPHGRPVIAVAWSQDESLLFSRSTDDGRTFSRPRRISAPGEAADLAVVVPGPWHALSVVYSAATASSRTSMVRVITSHDGGRTFAAPVTVPGGGALASQGARPYEVSLVGAAADPRTGTLYVTYAEEAGQPARLRVVLTHSRAGGRWTAPTEVDPAAGGPGSDQFQPSATATPQGQLYITYFVAAAGHVTEYLTQQAGLHSRTRRLGSPFDPDCGLTVGVKEIPWLGDYQALASSGGHAYAAWNDGGTGSLQILVEPVR
ncbi:MAG TPA: sialidase family protein [Trebonia sp.]